MPTYEITLTTTVTVTAENVAQADAHVRRHVRVIGQMTVLRGATPHDRNRYSYRIDIGVVRRSMPTRK